MSAPHKSENRLSLLQCLFLVLPPLWGFAALSIPLHARAQGRDIGTYEINCPAGEEWYLPTEDKASELYVYETGVGRPVVVIHGGFGAEHSYLLDAIRGLENDCRFILYDQRGSLRSPCQPDFISIQKHIQDLESLRHELKLEKMRIMAHSSGTLLAMYYLQMYPHNVENIVFVGPVAPKGGVYRDSSDAAMINDSQHSFEQFVERSEVKAEYKKAGIDQPNKSAKQLSRLFKISFAAGNIYHVERWALMRGGKVFWSQESAKATSRTLSADYNFIPVLRQHPYPITIIAGDHDLADFGNGIWRKVTGELRNAELIILKNAGHNCWIDEPGIFKRALKRGLLRTP
jgi:pimeloyl-ACP methyl ester carboxylesterase